MRELQALVRRLESLIEMRVAEENRLSSGIAIAAVKHSLEAHIAYLREQIKQTEQLIREHINNHPDLKEQSDLLDSIPGIENTTAALLLAEITNIKEYKSARQVAAYAGLVPRNDVRAAVFAGGCSCRKSGMLAFGRLFTFRQSRLCGAVTSSKCGLVDYASVANAKCRSSERRCGN